MATPPEVDQDQNMYVNFDSKAYISIPQFYAGRSIMITGGTGFMGKVGTGFRVFYHKVFVLYLRTWRIVHGIAIGIFIQPFLLLIFFE